MLVSIICGVYNAEKHIEKLMDSLVNQTYEQVEIILVVNATHDNTMVILQRYSDIYEHIHVYETPEKLGPGGARAKGVAYAKGDYIAIVDCDDYVSPDYIKNMVDILNGKVFYDVIISGFKRVDEDGQVKYVRRFNNTESALCQSVAPWAKLYSSAFLRRNDIVFRNIPFGEDILFTAEIILAKPKIWGVDSSDYYWVERLQSTSHTEIRGFPKTNCKIAIQYLNDMIEKYNPDKSALFYHIYKYFVWYLLHSGRNVRAKRMLKEYDKICHYLNVICPKWWKRNIMTIWQHREERNIVRVVLVFMLILRKIKLDKMFLSLYSVLPMERIWPSL